MKQLSPQSLSEPKRRLVAGWAADCAEHVLPIFEAELPDDDRPHKLIERARAFADGTADTATEIRNRFKGGVGKHEGVSAAARAVVSSAGQASAVAHMGAHALGAAAYAVKAVSLAHPNSAGAAAQEIQWQLENMSHEVRVALQSLPMVGENTSGPLGPGLLSSGQLGEIIRTLQENIASN